MATGSGGGRTREPGEMWNIRLKDATSLDDAGYVLKVIEESSLPKVDKCGATDVPYAINYRSTRDPHSFDEPPGVFKTGTQIGEMGIPVFREGWAKLKLATNNSALIVGDAIGVAASGGGKVDKYTPAALDTSTAAAVAASVETRFDQLGKIVGTSEQKLAAGTTSAPVQDKVLVKLSIRAIGITT